MRNVNIPYNIVGCSDLTPTDKTFLLWCWSVSTDDTRYNLISNKQGCHSRGRTIQLYAYIMGVDRAQVSRMFTRLRELGVIKAEHMYRYKCEYVDFTYFIS